MSDEQGDDTAVSRRGFGRLAAGTTLAAASSIAAQAQPGMGASAGDTVRMVGDVRHVSHGSLVVDESVFVPPGYATIYISGTAASVANPSAPKGSYESFGDVSVQTRSVLDNLKAILAKHGLTFADVVQAHVFMPPDPSKNGEADFASMNLVWRTEFGTAAQPNRPARSALKVAGLASPGLLVEIEMTAVKKMA